MHRILSSSTRGRQGRRASDAPSRSGDAWEVLDRLGVDPLEHFARLLLTNSEADEKRRDEAAKQLLPYCYARKPAQALPDTQGLLVGHVQCEG